MNTAALRSMQVTLTAIALATGAGVIAQQKELPEVKIEATHEVKPAGGISSHGTPIETVQLIRRVSYADLDLGTHSGATELEKRINDIARAACGQLLDTLYPVSTSAGPGAEKNSCIRGAVNGAMVQAKAAIAAAEKAKGSSN